MRLDGFSIFVSGNIASAKLPHRAPTEKQFK